MHEQEHTAAGSMPHRCRRGLSMTHRVFDEMTDETSREKKSNGVGNSSSLKDVSATARTPCLFCGIDAYIRTQFPLGQRHEGLG